MIPAFLRKFGLLRDGMKSFSLREDLISYLFCAMAGIVFINCAHQGHDDYPMQNRSNRVLVKPPAVPPAGPVAPKPSAPLVPAVGVSKPKRVVPSVPDNTVASSKEKAPNVAGLQLKLDEPLSPPVRRLIKSAEENLKKGKVLEARAQADRAYRMDLRDPRTSFLMAKVSVSEKDYEGAEQWAVRSLENLSDSANKQTVWGLIARVREKGGNKKGSAEAMRKRSEIRR